jgi:hypothetical protein
VSLTVTAKAYKPKLLFPIDMARCDKLFCTHHTGSFDDNSLVAPAILEYKPL